jgi:hypothetical protein
MVGAVDGVGLHADAVPDETGAVVDFWDAFFLLIIFIPLILMWSYAMIDIFRRDDLTGTGKAFWLLGIFVIPFLGTLLYLLFRPMSTVTLRTATEPRPPTVIARAVPAAGDERTKV